jgi:Flp pilus assembly pilin Flp
MALLATSANGETSPETSTYPLPEIVPMRTEMIKHETANVMGPRTAMQQVKRKLNQAGQGMAEYILIIGLVALLIFAAVQIFGKDIENLFNKANTDLQNVETSAS